MDLGAYDSTPASSSSLLPSSSLSSPSSLSVARVVPVAELRSDERLAVLLPSSPPYLHAQGSTAMGGVSVTAARRKEESTEGRPQGKGGALTSSRC